MYFPHLFARCVLLFAAFRGSFPDFTMPRGAEQIGARIAYNEIDMVLFFNDPRDEKSCESVSYISRLCDQNNIPFASNVATAEMLVLGLSRGDLDWRDIVNPKTKPFTA